MKNIYQHIGYYNDFEDIFDLFPSGLPKGDEADIVVKYMKDGYGAFHKIDHPDDETDLDITDLNPGELVLTTEDKAYAVRFEAGAKKILMKRNPDLDHGYFIDIYALKA